MEVLDSVDNNDVKVQKSGNSHSKVICVIRIRLVQYNSTHNSLQAYVKFTTSHC